MMTAVLTAVFVVAVLVAKDAVVAWWQTRKIVPPPPVPDAAIFAAVKQAALDLGLNGEALTRDVDLVATGKLYEVLHRAGDALGKDHELRTAGDVADWLAEAPDR